MPESKKIISVELTGSDKLGGSARYEDLRKNVRKVFRQIKHRGEWYASVSYSIFSLHELKSEVWDKEQRKYVWNEEADEKKQIDKHFSGWHCHVIVYAENDCKRLCDEITKRWVDVCGSKESKVKALKEYQKVIPCKDTGKIIYTLWQELHADYFPIRGIDTQRKIITKATEEFPNGKDANTLKNWRYSIEQGLQQFGGAQYLINLTYWNGEDHAQKQNEQVKKLWSDVRIKRDMKNLSKIFSRVRNNLARKDLMPLYGKHRLQTWQDLNLGHYGK